MINVHIHLDESLDARAVVLELLQRKLIAHASIDNSNKTLIYDKGELKTDTCNVITAQTRAMLFSKVVEFIDEHYRGHIKVYSTPITQSNNLFAQIIREATEKV
ncbi:MAG TPA: divalent cation tolerance protein CutA [Flavobacteriales bacterium]|nr:divalent cation tolerance protein CutA [Flavobacteriales bacterium]